MLYPKIHSLGKRHGWYFDEKEKKECLDLSRQAFRQSFIEGDYACPEFGAINNWMIDEKIDGTNVRIFWDPNNPASVRFGGRTDNAQLPMSLLSYLQDTFTPEKFYKQFPDARRVVLFGEGYGPKIQACGGRYRDTVSFILFDVGVDEWWLEKEAVLDIAGEMGIERTRGQEIMTTQGVIEFVKSKPHSYIAKDQTLVMEGVIARSVPLMLFRNHKTPIMFKLKCRDFFNKDQVND